MLLFGSSHEAGIVAGTGLGSQAGWQRGFRANLKVPGDRRTTYSLTKVLQSRLLALAISCGTGVGDKSGNRLT